MTTFNTRNPLGSAAPKDLYDNAENLDFFSNGSDPFYPDRFGVMRRSLSGIQAEFTASQAGREAEFEQFLADSAFVFIGDYGAGLTFTSRSQYMIRDGVPYRLAASTTLPYTTTGNWALEQTKFTPISDDQVLRQDLAMSSGSSLIGYRQRTVQAKLDEALNVKDFGAVGNGVADDTAAIQAALTAAGVNGVLNFAPGVYLLSDTLNAPFGCWLRGSGGAWQAVVLKRSGDYGDTLVFGDASPSGYCGPARVSDMFFQHGTMYNTGDTALDNIATSGAHIRMFGSQGAQIENCWLWRMPSQIVFEGGSVAKIENCSFKGIFDHANPNLQEGFAQVWLKKSTNHGYPVTFVFSNCEFNGANVNARTVNITTGDGTVSRSIAELIGSTFGLYVDAVEDLSISDCYLGGFNINAIKFNTAIGSGCIDVRIYGNHFDGARDFQINFDSSGVSQYALGVQIFGNTFNGEVVSKGGIIVQNSSGAGHSLANFAIFGNTFFQTIGTPICLFAANGGSVAGNTISSWNTLNVATTDAQWCAGVYCDSAVTKNVAITGNTVGGGGNAFDQSTGNTFTYKGIVIGTTCQNVGEQGTRYVGIRSGSNFRTGIAQSPNQVFPTAEANYQMTAEDDVWIRGFTATAATAVQLPQYPMAGREVVVKDGTGGATTWVIVIGTADGALIDGAASLNISTNYGFARLRFNGTQWNRIG